MDASALLLRQGWKGAGHSLDQSGRGIRRPLLITHKQDQLGLGTQRTALKVDDQWWMRAFDESLKVLGTGKESTLSQVRSKGINRGGLYGFFVKGEGLKGTVVESTDENSAAETATSSEAVSRVSTPPTSPSDGESGARKSNKGTKRKRGEEKEKKSHKSRKLDKSRTESCTVKTELAKLAITTPMGTFDASEIERIQATLRTLKRDAKATVKKNEKRGTYGIYVSSKTNSDAKAAKMRRKPSVRQARKALQCELGFKAMVNGKLPNPMGWKEKEIRKKFSKPAKAYKTIDKR